MYLLTILINWILILTKKYSAQNMLFIEKKINLLLDSKI